MNSALRSISHLKRFLDAPNTGKESSDLLWYSLNLDRTPQGRVYWTDRYWGVLYKDPDPWYSINHDKLFPEMSEEDFAYLRSLLSTKTDPFLLDKDNKEYLIE